jgi:hypothetical protein
MILKILSKNRRKIWRFGLKNTAESFEKWIITLVLRKTPFFAENL